MASSTRTRGTADHAELPVRAKILAIDYGRKRLGLAVSDELGLTAHTLPVIVRTNRGADMRRLRELAKEKVIRLIIVGSPVHLSGRMSEMAEEAEKFAARLEKELGLPVELRDERLTSWEAEEMARQSKASKNSEIDSVAAAILLREYLEEAHAVRTSKSTVRESCEK
jgi:putative holliday junction resolvase